MKVIKIIFAFIIFYFLITMFSGMVSLARILSAGSQVIEIGFYVFVGILILVFLVWPILKYMSYPSTQLISRMHKGDKRAVKKLYRHYRKIAKFDAVSSGDTEVMKTRITKHITEQIKGFDKEIQKTALKLTTSVIISPNSFIDGLIIILGNSQMVYKLSKSLGLRYTAKEIFNMYFKVFAVASVSGIIQEFDDEIEEFLIDIVEAITKDTGKSIPFANIAISAVGPILQASTNYAFVIYNGLKFKYHMLKLAENSDKTERDISKIARKEARKSRLKYFGNTLKKIKFKRNLKTRDAEV